MTEVQKVLAGVAVAIAAVIYNTLKVGSIGVVELASTAIAIIFLLAVGFWLSKSAKRRDQLQQADDLTITEKPQQELETQEPRSQSLARYLGDHSNPSSLPIEADRVKKAYHELIDLIIYHEDKRKFHEAVDSKEFLEDDDPQYYFFQLNKAFLEISHLFFINLDWKQGADDLHLFTQKILENTPYKPKLPFHNKYPSNASILFGLEPGEILSQVFEEYILVLNEVGLSIAFLETDADYFVIFIYRLEDEESIKQCIADAGLFFGTPK